MKRPLFVLAMVFFVAQIVASFFNYRVLFILSALCFVTALVAVIIKRCDNRIAVISFTIFIAIFAVAFNKHQALDIIEEYSGCDREIEGRIISVSSDDYSSHVMLNAYEIDGKRCNVRIALSINDNIFAKPDYFLKFKADLESALINTDSSNVRRYFSDSIYLSSFVYSNEDIDVFEGKGFRYYLYNIRSSIEGVLSNELNEDQSAISQAMLLGDKGNLSSAIRSWLSICGVSHVVAVSGMHLSIIITMIISILGSFNVKRRLISFISIIAVIIVSCLALFSPSILRASLMTSLYCISKILYRKSDSLNSLGFAGLLIMLFNPMSCFDLGFQLSFFATLGIVTVGNSVISKISRRDLKDYSIVVIKLYGLWRIIFESLVLTFAALIFTTPLIIYEFKAFSLVTPLANIGITILAPLILCLTIVVVIIGLIPIINAIVPAFAYILGLIINLFIVTIRTLSGFEFARISVDGDIAFYISLFCLVVFCILFFFYKNKVVRIAGAALCSVLIIVTSIVFKCVNADATTVKVIRSSSNGCNVIIASRGEFLVIDAGGDSVCYEDTMAYLSGRTKNVSVYALPFEDDSHSNVVKDFLNSFDIETTILKKNTVMFYEIYPMGNDDDNIIDMTFGRIVANGHDIIIDDLVDGKAIFLNIGDKTLCVAQNGYPFSNGSLAEITDVLICSQETALEGFPFAINDVIIYDNDNFRRDCTVLYYKDNPDTIVIDKKCRIR